MKKQILILMLATASLQLNGMADEEFINAAEQGDIDEVLRGLRGDIKTKKPIMHKAFVNAARANHTAIAGLLFLHGAPTIYRPFINAALNGNYDEALKELEGADKANHTIPQEIMQLALILSIEAYKPEIAQLLILNGADPSYNNAEAVKVALDTSVSKIEDTSSFWKMVFPTYSTSMLTILLTTITLNERKMLVNPKLALVTALEKKYGKALAPKDVKQLIAREVHRPTFEEIINVHMARFGEIKREAIQYYEAQHPRQTAPAGLYWSIENAFDNLTVHNAVAFNLISLEKYNTSKKKKWLDYSSKKQEDKKKNEEVEKRRASDTIQKEKNRAADQARLETYFGILGLAWLPEGSVSKTMIKNAYDDLLPQIQEPYVDNYYKVLNIRPSSSQQETREAYENAIQPFITSTRTSMKAKRIDDAYKALYDDNIATMERKRSEYNKKLSPQLFEAYTALINPTPRADTQPNYPTYNTERPTVINVLDIRDPDLSLRN